ncbi:MAG TPA: hypothetical protein VHM24_03390, partial [Gemmatimonadaceae bacterium]|nr:hypothetical protein [Gemmatimonadaceae bacterium]
MTHQIPFIRWTKRIARLLGTARGTLLCLAFLIGAPGALRAQEDPPPGCDPRMDVCDVDSLPPRVIIMPASGSFTRLTAISLRVLMCDQLSINDASYQLFINNIDRTADYPAGYIGGDPQCVESNVREAVGSLTIDPGSTSVYARICDNAANCMFAENVYTYRIGEVLVNGRSSVRRGAGSPFKQRFTLRNIGGETYQYSVSPQCTGAVTGCSVLPTSVNLAPNQSAVVELTYVAGATGTTGDAGIKMAYNARAQYTNAITVVAIPPTYSVEVSPKETSVPAAAGAQNSQQFVIRNVGNAAATYSLSSLCSGSISGCSIPSATSQVPPGDSAMVTLSLLGGAVGTTGVAEVRASYGTYADTGRLTVYSQEQTRAFVLLDSLEIGPQVARDECLTSAIAAASAYECGDLRIVHPLPVVRTFNKSRAPTLLYNSAHALAGAVVGAVVTFPSGPTRPSTVTAVLKVAGATRDSAQWAGSDWVPGAGRRIALRLRNAAQDSGLVSFSLEVTGEFGGTRLPAVKTGEVIVVNRAKSPFGAGWWLAGLERLLKADQDTMIWLGGDGSARRYTRVSPTAWVARALDRPDTIRKLDAQTLARIGPNRLQVQFNLSGQHVATVNRHLHR